MTVVTSDLYQEMIGFGGSMTDSAGINLNTLSAEARENVLRLINTKQFLLIITKEL